MGPFFRGIEDYREAEFYGRKITGKWVQDDNTVILDGLPGA